MSIELFTSDELSGTSIAPSHGVAMERLNEVITQVNANEDLIGGETSAALELYVDPLGDDDLGDGSSSFPYLTITKAYSEVPKVLKHAVQIKIGAGTYTEFPAIIGNECQDDGQLIFDGVDGLSDDEGTLTALAVTTVDAGAYFYDVQATGAAWVVDEHVGKFAVILTGTNAGKYCKIVSNTADVLRTHAGYESGIEITDTFTIGSPQVIVNVAAGINTTFAMIDRESKVPIYSAVPQLARLGLCFISLNFAGNGLQVVGQCALGCVHIDAVSDYSLVLHGGSINSYLTFPVPAKVSFDADVLGTGGKSCFIVETMPIQFVGDFSVVGMAAIGILVDVTTFGSNGFIYASYIGYTQIAGGYVNLSATVFEWTDNLKDSVDLAHGASSRMASVYFSHGKSCILMGNADVWAGTLTHDVAGYTQYGVNCLPLSRLTVSVEPTLEGSLGQIYFKQSATAHGWPSLNSSVTDGQGAFVVCG